MLLCIVQPFSWAINWWLFIMHSCSSLFIKSGLNCGMKSILSSINLDFEIMLPRFVFWRYFDPNVICIICFSVLLNEVVYHLNIVAFFFFSSQGIKIQLIIHLRLFRQGMGQIFSFITLFHFGKKSLFIVIWCHPWD